MTPDLYFTIGIPIAALCLIGGVLSIALGDGIFSDSPFDMFMGIVLAFMMSLVAGAVWPATALVGTIWGLVMGVKALANRPPKHAKPRPETDREKYLRMAREQRDLAKQSRRQNMEDVAQMQDDLASQYEQLANVYSNN